MSYTYTKNKIEILEKMKQKRFIDKIKDPLQVKIKDMIKSCKYADNKKRYYKEYENAKWRYDENDYINKEFLNELWKKQKGICYYKNCKCSMSLNFDKQLTYDDNTELYEYKHDLNKVSIQRLNNEYPHIKSNCVFSCLRCNLSVKKF